jgi:histidine triad (HIT) family protein
LTAHRAAATLAPIFRTSRREPTMTAYDNNNAFAKILRGEFPCYKVYENEHTLAFLDIMPRAPGHTLVIPKAPARNILDITEEDYLHVGRATRIIARAAKDAFNADGLTIQQFNESAGGQVVFHLHVHVMPRHDGIALLPPASRKEDAKVLEENAAKLVAALQGM